MTTAAVVAMVRQQVQAIDPDLPLYRVRPMTAWVDQSLARQRFAMLLLSLFAGVALVLATIGVYGVTAYLVSQTTREIGIRIALGATDQAVVGMIVRQGLAVCLAGMGLGLAGALAATRFTQRLLFGIRDLTTDDIELLCAERCRWECTEGEQRGDESGGATTMRHGETR